MHDIRTHIRMEIWDELPTKAKETLNKHLKDIIVIRSNGNKMEKDEIEFHDKIKQAIDSGCGGSVR